MSQIINSIGEQYVEVCLQVIRTAFDRAPAQPQVTAAWIINALNFYANEQLAHKPKDIRGTSGGGVQWQQISRFMAGEISKFIGVGPTSPRDSLFDKEFKI